MPIRQKFKCDGGGNEDLQEREVKSGSEEALSSSRRFGEALAALSRKFEETLACSRRFGEVLALSKVGVG